MPTERPVTNDKVKVSWYAREVSPAMRPEPRRFSTPMPCVLPTMQSSAQRVSEPDMVLVASTVPSGSAL